MKAIILEDNLSLAESLKKTLEGQGWTTESSPSWAKVAHKVENQKYQLIVLDILLADKKGTEILKKLSEKKIHSKIIIISGFFNKDTLLKGLPKDFLQHCFFLKKPFTDKDFLSHIQIERKFKSDKWDFFFEKGIPEKPISFYFPDTKSFKSSQLIPLLFSAHLKAFTGDIILEINSKKNFIHFYKGNIIRIVSSSQKSFFGEILVEHGLSLTENVQEILNDKNNKKRIGERLLEKELLSPHMLDFILKEQIKIRLSEFMSYPELQLILIQKKTENFEKIEIEFNKTDFIDWLVDSIQTELKPDFWKSFYFDVKPYQLSQLSPLNTFSVSQKPFFNQYNKFFKSLDTKKRLNQLILDYKDESIKFLFFGLLIKSIYLKKLSKAKQALEDFKKHSHQILSSTENEILNLLGHPHPALQLIDIKKNYKDMISRLHPDTLPEGSNDEMKQMSEESLEKVTLIYKKLLKTFQKDANTLAHSSQDLIHVMNAYQKGIDLIQNSSYTEAHSVFSEIKDHSQAPSNTCLYILWAFLKKENLDLTTKDRVEGTKIQKEINSYPIHLRTSYLFWFVKGLFYYRCKEYERARELFKKSLFIESSFSPAKLELLLVKQKLKKETKKNSLFSFLKKSS